jgi:uncharacterized protein YdcH (DUF465 family)
MGSAGRGPYLWTRKTGEGQPMSHTPHELHEEFPDHAHRIHDLRENDPHFAQLCDSYHQTNRAVHRAETNVEPTSDDHMTELRKARMVMKDQIWRRLADH